MSITCTLHVNLGSADVQRDASGVIFREVDTADIILWSDGSSDVADGQPIPTEAELNIAASLLGDTNHEVAYCFLLDQSTGLTERITNAGSVNKRYVFCFEFDGATATEPTLEAWDNTNHDTNDNYCLGEGTGTNSWLKGVLTTVASPGASWTGTPISGNGASSRIDLNGGLGALSVATDVYVNLKMLIPSGFSTPNSEQPLMTVRYTWN